MKIDNLSTLKIHKLTQEQYDAALRAGKLESNEIYLTPDEPIDLSPYATKAELQEEISARQLADSGKQATIEGAATTITKDNLTKNRVLVSNTDGKVAVSAITSIELGYLDGVTSAIQTQLENKLSTTGTAAKATADASGNTITTTYATKAALNEHVNKKDNPHGVTKTQVGLGNVENTADKDKNVATAVKATQDASGNVITTTYATKAELQEEASARELADSGKQATITGAATTITNSDLTTNRALISNSSGKIAVSDVTSTELGYLDGVTSAIQTQLDNKLAIDGTAADSLKLDGKAASEYALKSAVDIINGNENTNGSIAKSLADSKEYTDTQLKSYLKTTDIESNYETIRNASSEISRVEDLVSKEAQARSAADVSLSNEIVAKCDATKEFILNHVEENYSTTSAINGKYATKTALGEAMEFIENEVQMRASQDDLLQDQLNKLYGITDEDNVADKGKTIREIATHEIAKQLIAEDANEKLNELKEIADWIQSHPGDAAAMNTDILDVRKEVYGTADGKAPTTGTNKGSSRIDIIDESIAAINLDKISKSSEGIQTIAGGLVVGATTTNGISGTGKGRVMFTGQTNPLIGVQAISNEGELKTPYYIQTVAGDDCLYIGPTSTKALKFDADGNMSSPSNLTIKGTITEGTQLLSNKYEAKGAAASTAEVINARIDPIENKSVHTNIAYGTCSTAATTAAKVITIQTDATSTPWELKKGSVIIVTFTKTNSASNPTFNVNRTGAKSVYYEGKALTTSSLGYGGTANRPMIFVYDGSAYRFAGWGYDENTDTKVRTYRQGTESYNNDYPLIASKTALSGLKNDEERYDAVYGLVSTTDANAPTVNPYTGEVKVKSLKINGDTPVMKAAYDLWVADLDSTKTGSGAFVKNVSQTDGKVSITMGDISASELPTHTQAASTVNFGNEPYELLTIQQPLDTLMVEVDGYIYNLKQGLEELEQQHDLTELKVKQDAQPSTNGNFRVLFSKSANDTAENDTVYKASGIDYNPSTKLTTLYKLSTSNGATLNSLEVSNNASVKGTLGVTGLTSLSSLNTSGNTSIGGTLGVTGATTMTTVAINSGLTSSGQASFNGQAIFSETHGVKIGTGVALKYNSTEKCLNFIFD